MSRTGRTVINATPGHSLYSYDGGAFVSQGANIYAIEANMALTLAKALTSSENVSYDATAGTAYYSNGVDTGRFVGRTPKQWGVVPPANQPASSATTGNLPAGRYTYALTFLRMDGHESGTGLAGAIDLSVTGGIRFDGIEVSTNPEISAKIVYLSSRNGETLYRAAVILNSQTSAVVADEPRGIPLITQFASAAPPGTLVRIFNGVAYVISGNTVYYSEPYNLELFFLERNFMQFPGTISMFDWANDGVYVATTDTEGDGTEGNGTTWFLHGNRPDKFNPTQVFNYGSTPGTSVKLESGFFGALAEKIGSPSLIWTSRHGVCVGGDGGIVHNLTEGTFSLPSAIRGAALVREYRGFVQYITSMQGAGADNNAYTETI